MMCPGHPNIVESRSDMNRASRVDLLGLCRVKGASWYFLAREAQRPGGLDRLLAGVASEDSREAREWQTLFAGARAKLDEHRAVAEATLNSAESEGDHITTVLDED